MGDQVQTVKSGTGIQRSSRTRTRKKKKNQIPLGILALLFVVAVGILLAKTVSSNVALFWLLGSAFGFVLQRSRFCFTASMRDPYLTGSTSLTKAVLTAFAVTTIGFAAIKYGAFVKGLPIPG
ncbi:MAG: YeeE/YedE family protein, partial [Spirochaetaceae bacterium]|nr:YeeE/YedE family protein [Spirochaetaceae bacterium]